MYKIFETGQFISDLDDLPKAIKTKMHKKLSQYVYLQLSKNPHCGLNIKKLKNYDPETWRYRIGNFRIFFEISETEMTIFIISIDHRKDAY